VIALFYGVLHLCGLRAHAAFLSGTPVGGPFATLCGFVYVLAHFACVVCAPIMALAAGLLALSCRLAQGQPTTPTVSR
jgi:hypothetical protein